MQMQAANKNTVTTANETSANIENENGSQKWYNKKRRAQTATPKSQFLKNIVEKQKVIFFYIRGVHPQISDFVWSRLFKLKMRGGGIWHFPYYFEGELKSELKKMKIN